MGKQSESSTENFRQGIARFLRLAMVLPETEMSLIYWSQDGKYQVAVGKEPPEVSSLRIELGGVVKITTNWKELYEWAVQLGEMRGEQVGSSDT